MTSTASASGSLFIGLDTYSSLGGVQRFNQRVIAGLADPALQSALPHATIHLMRDRNDQLPALTGVDMRGFGPNRIEFIRASLAAARNASILLVGQLNLLPVMALAKLVNPRLRSVLFVHGIEVWNDPLYRKRRPYEPHLLRLVDRVASVSSYTADKMRHHFGVPREKFTIFPNAVDGPVTTERPNEGAPILLVVSRMAEHDRGKNFDATIRAFAELVASVPDAKLEIVGDGQLRPELEALAASLGIASRVAFLGRISDAELDACYRRATAFVLPSSKEGFGIVYLEAWKHGLPVICGTEGAPHEIVADGIDGFVVDPNDIAALTGRMSFLLSDKPAARQMGKAGAEKVARHYLDDALRRNLSELIRETLQ